MPDRQFHHTGQIGEILNRLARKLSDETSQSPVAVLQHSLNEIAGYSPFTAAALLSGDTTTGENSWAQRDSSGFGERFFNQLNTKQSELLHSIRREQEPVQHDLDDLLTDADTEGRCYFIGLPAGNLDHSPCSIGVLSQRELTNDELQHLTSFSRFLGMAAENARLNNLLTPNDAQSPVANLIGLIAHELRTPLTGMRGNIQLAMMSSQKGQTERVPDRLQAAIAGIDGMASLVQKLLDVSRLERGNFQLHRAHANVRATVLAAIDSALGESAPDDRVIRLIEGDPVDFDHDQQSLELALTYLLSTSMGYREADTHIAVMVHSDSDTTRIELSYRGSPLSDVDQHALSAPLYERQPRSSSRNGPELSLDLAYVRGVVLYHDGRIELHTDDTDSSQQSIAILFPAESTG